MPNVEELAVWVADRRAGLLARETNRQHVFGYDCATPTAARYR